MELIKNKKKGLNLAPKAAEYYKRLLLVADRYVELRVRYKRLKLYSWVITLIALAEAYIILSRNGWL
jgi:hypothetical protein